jgi:hypothetical protein
MTDITSFTRNMRGRPLSWWRRAYRGLLAEVRMVAAWLWAFVTMGIESMLRFAPGPGDTVMIRPPGQPPGVASTNEESGTIPHRRKGTGDFRGPSSIRAVRPNRSASRLEPLPSKRGLKIFHAARHPEE